MSNNNLGMYQDFTIAAKAAGGVSEHLRDLEHGAVVRASPVLLLLGAGMGVVGVKVKQWNDRRLERARATLASLYVDPETGTEGTP